MASGNIKLSAFPSYSSGSGYWWKFGNIVFFNVLGVIFSNQSSSSSVVQHIATLSALEMPVSVASNFDFQCGSGNSQAAELYIYPTDTFDFRTYSFSATWGCGFYVVH